MTTLVNSSAVLVTAQIEHELQQLQAMLAAPSDPAALSAQVDRVAALCATQRQTLADAVDGLIGSNDGLQGLLDLLEQAEQPLPIHQLRGLLAPLQQHVQQETLQLSQML